MLKRMFQRLAQNFQNIRMELLLSYSVVILVSIVLVGIVSYHYASRSLSEIMQNANEQIAYQIQNTLDHDFQNKRDLLLAPYYDSYYMHGINHYATMSTNERFVFIQRLVILFLKSFYISPQNDFIGFSIYFRDGTLLYASNPNVTIEENVTEQPWFQKTVENNGVVYFNSEQGNDRYFGSIMIREFSSVSEFIIVRTEYNMKRLENIKQASNISENSFFVIYNEDGHVVFPYAEPEQEKEELYAAVYNEVNGTKGAFWYEVNATNDLHITHVASEKTGWDIVLFTPDSDIFIASDKIKEITIIIAALAFLITLTISIGFARRITNPIFKLYQTVNYIKRGDLSMRVEINSQNELGRIATNFNSMVDDLEELINTKYIYQIKLREAELVALYSQINPHFLYNTLDSIRSMAQYYNVKEIANVTSSLADMFRYNTKHDGEWVFVRDEVSLIEHYLLIQKVRFGEKLQVDFDVDEHLFDARMLKMTLQPLIENAMIHGFESKRENWQLTVRIEEDDEFICIEITDNGIGMTALQRQQLMDMLNQTQDHSLLERKTISKGIGINNVYSRYAILCGDDFNFDIQSSPEQGTTISMKFPLVFGSKDAGKEIHH